MVACKNNLTHIVKAWQHIEAKKTKQIFIVHKMVTQFRKGRGDVGGGLKR